MKFWFLIVIWISKLLASNIFKLDRRIISAWRKVKHFFFCKMETDFRRILCIWFYFSVLENHEPNKTHMGKLKNIFFHFKKKLPFHLNDTRVYDRLLPKIKICQAKSCKVWERVFFQLWSFGNPKISDASRITFWMGKIYFSFLRGGRGAN